MPGIAAACELDHGGFIADSILGLVARPPVDKPVVWRRQSHSSTSVLLLASMASKQLSLIRSHAGLTQLSSARHCRQSSSLGTGIGCIVVHRSITAASVDFYSPSNISLALRHVSFKYVMLCLHSFTLTDLVEHILLAFVQRISVINYWRLLSVCSQWRRRLVWCVPSLLGRNLVRMQSPAPEHFVTTKSCKKIIHYMNGEQFQERNCR